MDVLIQQETTDPHLRIPRVLPFLAQCMKQFKGFKAVGIWRISGSSDVVGGMKSRIDRRHYDMVRECPEDVRVAHCESQSGTRDPHVVASLFKQFLRDLPEPLIPVDLYERALRTAQDPWQSCALVPLIAELPRRVLLYTIAFLQ